MKHKPASPHGPIESVFPGIWFVRGGVKMPMFVPVKMGRSMTIVRDAAGALTLLNSMRLSDAGLAELEALGTVTNVVRIAGFHGRDDGFYRERYGAKVFAIEGQRYVRAMEAKKDPSKDYMRADTYLTEESTLPIADAELKVFSTSDPPEAVLLLKRDGGILVTGDSLQHTPEPDEYCNLPARLMMRKFGFFKPHAVGAGWLQFASPSSKDVRSVLDLSFEHVLPGLGTPIIGAAKQKYRPALEAGLAGCHS
ncbi:MAG: hypothetical protein JKY37_05930 [Nannocystaceae bacterium]|nr:hypothetical protein [Nannocystaceae bacterium]